MPDNGNVEKVWRNEAGQLLAQVHGREAPVADARVARCFPWSLPDRYIAIRDKDGKELALLQTLAELDPASRAVVEEELREKVFHPTITRVVDHKSEFGIISITVETNRGQVTFEIRSRDDVRVLSPTRALFRDADGNTYELADLNTLDSPSRKILADYF